MQGYYVPQILSSNMPGLKTNKLTDYQLKKKF